jgi:hypothetical protein
MGRARNRKWRKRLQRWLKASTVAEKVRLQHLFGRHRKFNVLR